MKSCRALYRAWPSMPRMVASEVFAEPRRHRNLAVTTFNTQLCELQGIYNMDVPKIATEAMTRGHAIHAALEEEALQKEAELTGVPVVRREVAVKPKSEEEYALKLTDMAHKLRVLGQGIPVRELRVVGTAGETIELTGVIDEIAVEDDGIVICDTKTTRVGPPADWKLRMAYHQLLVYHHMLTQMASAPLDISVFDRQGLDSVKVLDAELELRFSTLSEVYEDVCVAVDEARPVLLSLKDLVRVDFISAKPARRDLYEYKVDAGVSEELFRFRTSLFEDQRPALAVDPKDGFCKFCQFQPECPVYGRQ